MTTAAPGAVPAVTVFLAAGGPADGVLDVLCDLSAVGLLEPFLWVPAAERPGDELAALRVAAGRRTGTTVAAALSGARVERVRLAVVVPVLTGAPGVSVAAEQVLVAAVESVVGNAELVRLRCLLTRPGAGVGAGAVAREGWHNLLVVPEDADGPGRGLLVLPAAADAVELGRHAAPALAALTGLWSGVPEAPLDAEAVLPGETVRAVRTFFRRLDAVRVEEDLRAALLAMDHGLPVPRQHGAPVVQVADVGLATSGMADALWTKHAAVLRGPRESVPAEVTTPLGAGAALRMLFGFLGAALRNAPGRWYSATVNRVSSSVAGAVHGAVFGSAPASYTVVVNGVTPKGLPVGWRDIGTATDELSQVLATPGEPRAHEAQADLGPLWQDFVAGALTLADAGERVDVMPPVLVGGSRGVVGTAADCAPAHEDRFAQVPGPVAAAVQLTEVSASDVLGTNVLQRRLEQAQSDQAVGMDAGRTLQALGAWRAQHQRSYTVQVGTTLGRALLGTAGEIQGLLARIRDAATAGDDDPAAAARQRRIALLMQVFTATFVVVLAVLGVLLGLGALGIGLVAVLAAGALLLWLLGLGITFVRGQRELFRELARRRTAVSEAEVARVNLRHALRDAARLHDAYAQYLSWSSVLGSVLRAPFGPPAPRTPAAPRIGSGLPRAARVGVAVPDGQTLAATTAVLRGEVFRVGWLTRAWESTLAEAGARLGHEAYEVAQTPRLLYGRPGEGTRSELTDWAALLRRDGVGTRGGDELWAHTLAQLARTQPRLAADLLSGIEVAGPTGTTRVDLAEFLAGVDGVSVPAGAQRFDSAVFAPDAVASGRLGVVASRVSASQHGLSRLAVTTQLGDGLPSYQLRLEEGPARHDDAGPGVAAPEAPSWGVIPGFEMPGTAPVEPGAHRSGPPEPGPPPGLVF